MKKTIIAVATIALVYSSLPIIVQADTDEDFFTELSAMINEYDSEDYFGLMSVTIGDTDLIVDGERIAIDDTGSSAYIENGRTMMPVRGIAEAMGVDVGFDENSQTVSLMSVDKNVEISLDESSITINGDKASLLTPPEIKNNRTMLPVRDVAEALDCEVKWDEESQTVYFTRPFQTRRIIAMTEKVDADAADASVSGNGITVMQFETSAKAKAAMEEIRGSGVMVEPDYIRTVDSLSWGTEAIGTASYIDYIKGKTNKTTIAVIDTGIDSSHPVFEGRLAQGYDFYNNDKICEDTLGHGTHVSSTIIDVTRGIDDIAIMPIKVFGDINSTPTSIIYSGMMYAADHGAKVINMSLGGSGLSTLEEKAVNYARSKNIAVIASAGNNNFDLTENKYSPAVIDGVVTVSAVDENLEKSFYSNFGMGIIDFAAPGDKINGAKAGGGYKLLSGTSMATPHVSGIYALAFAARPDLSADEITAALKKNGKYIGSAEYYGAGLINADGLEQLLPAEKRFGNAVKGIVVIPESYEDLSIRSGPSTKYDVLGGMLHGENCDVFPEMTENGWYFVQYNGIYGYAAGNYIYIPDETEYGIVCIPNNFENLSIRTGPSTSYEIVGSMPDGGCCTVLPDKEKNGWYYICYNGVLGYASGNYIVLEADTAAGKVVIPNYFENLSIRSGPATEHEILGSMPDGAMCEVYPKKENNGWYYVRYGSIHGYVYGKYIEIV